MLNQPLPTGSEANGFYASAYSVGGEIVISYRGSDDWLDAWNDLLTITGLPIPGNLRVTVGLR